MFLRGFNYLENSIRHYGKVYRQNNTLGKNFPFRKKSLIYYNQIQIQVRPEHWMLTAPVLIVLIVSYKKKKTTQRKCSPNTVKYLDLPIYS